MNKICTSLEQSKKLIELGIDVNTADMYRWYSGRRYYIESMDDDDFNEESDIPAWSLTALIELMPERIKIDDELSFCLASKKSSTGFSFGYNLNGSTFVTDNPLDAAFEMVVWLKVKVAPEGKHIELTSAKYAFLDWIEKCKQKELKPFNLKGRGRI